MDDQQLTQSQLAEAGLDDWRMILGRLKARFRTGDPGTGYAFVTAIGQAASTADHYPDLTLTSADVVVGLAGTDASGITARDVDLAREISRLAAQLGVPSDVTGLTQLELGLDTAAGTRLAPFYAALFGTEVIHGEPVDRSGQVPTVWWQEPDETNGGPALPTQSFEQRWHFDVWVGHDEGEHRLRAVLDAGGRLVSDAAAPAYWVVEDADGNRSCICTPVGR
jgi:4a-hydroxytetrahydrobiopterin dehydratase